MAQRLQRPRRGDGESFPKTTRTSSNISSPSSDILVASTGLQTSSSATTQQQEPFSITRDGFAVPPTDRTTKASTTNGRMFSVRFGSDKARNAFRSIVRRKPRPVSSASIFESVVDDEDYALDGEGPNHRGTFSKEYTLKHPEMKWMHRGQGRYLPVSTPRAGNSSPAMRPIRQTRDRAVIAIPLSDETIQELFEDLHQRFDNWRRSSVPNAKDNWNPAFKSRYNAVVSLLTSYPDGEWSKAPDYIKDKSSRTIVREWLRAIEPRLARDIGARDNGARDSGARSIHSRGLYSRGIDGDEDGARKPRSAHDIGARDSGAHGIHSRGIDGDEVGVRTRLSRNTNALPSIETRRSFRLTETPSHLLLQNSTESDADDMDNDDDELRGPRGTYKKGYVDAHPDEEFHHAGNGWYKKGPRPHPASAAKASTHRDSSSSSHPMKLESEESGGSDHMANVHSKDLHKFPGSTYYHAGNGWYKPGIGPHGKRASVTVAPDGSLISGRHSTDDHENSSNSCGPARDGRSKANNLGLENSSSSYGPARDGRSKVNNLHDGNGKNSYRPAYDGRYKANDLDYDNGSNSHGAPHDGRSKANDLDYDNSSNSHGAPRDGRSKANNPDYDNVSNSYGAPRDGRSKANNPNYHDVSNSYGAPRDGPSNVDNLDLDNGSKSRRKALYGLPNLDNLDNIDADKDTTFIRPETENAHRENRRTQRNTMSIGNLMGATVPSTTRRRRSSRTDETADESLSLSLSQLRSHDEPTTQRASTRQKRTSRASQNSQGEERTDELFSKEHVAAHPDEEYHHRGQGRYARGRRPKSSISQDPEEAALSVLVDTEYVELHPTETFHHRGQGKWARGLPPPGSNSKMAVRGPGALDREEYRRAAEEVNEHGERAPGLLDMVHKADGPAKWPKIHFYYRGGGKWSRTSKEEADRIAGKKASYIPVAQRGNDSNVPVQREARAKKNKVQQRPAQIGRRRSAMPTGGTSKAAPNNSPSKAPTPRPALLAPEDDRLTEEDLPGLYKDEWSNDDEDGDPSDEVKELMRQMFKPIVGADPFIKALTKHDPAVRSLDSLKALASNTVLAMMQMQDEYLELDKITAANPTNGKKARKPVSGGRVLADDQVFEDKKEATLYDYTYDPRKIGFQDPDAQKIVRDAEGRELRRRRNRQGIDLLPLSALDDVNGEGSPARRTVRPISRFDGVVVQPPRKKSRLSTMNSTAPLSLDPLTITPTIETPAATDTISPSSALASPDDFSIPTRGRWKGHVPKRIAELRGVSLASNRSESGSPKPGGSVRKGRPPGSKNLHKRKDAGIKKGPRKPKSEATSVEPSERAESMEYGSDAMGVGEGEELVEE